MEWKEVFQKVKKENDFSNLNEVLSEKYSNGSVFPPRSEIYKAFELTPFENVKVVIIGQDPYHGDNQAHGLSFSVNEGVKIPPSLNNIYKELYDDLGVTRTTGNLEDWARQGVLLLNTVLTVDAHNANSHRGLGWETFTDEVIKAVSAYLSNVVFILWGKPAQTKEKLVDTEKHHIIKSVHPSPLSAHRGFFGSKPFSKTNEYLKSHGRGSIDWGEHR